MSRFNEFVTPDRRLVILKALNEDAGYSHNSSVLQTILAQFGHRVSRDVVHTDLAWLEEQGLITTEDVASVRVATLTDRGADVATGAATVPGVKRPRPQR